MPQVDDDTPLRIRPGEKTPRPGHEGSVPVAQEDWEAHDRREDTAGKLARDRPPVE